MADRSAEATAAEGTTIAPNRRRSQAPGDSIDERQALAHYPDGCTSNNRLRSLFFSNVAASG
jgi:hypothetical protein